MTPLDKESGGHRIQRYPKTDTRGRIHTSTVVVSVYDPDRVKHDLGLDQRSPGDFRLEWYSGSGSGGQHRNKHQNSARITHVPTGITRTAQTRDRENSKRLAMESLLGELDRIRQTQTRTIRHVEKREQTGSGQRGDKIRTYRFQDNITTDHRSGRKAPTDTIMRGRFDLV